MEEEGDVENSRSHVGLHRAAVVELRGAVVPHYYDGYFHSAQPLAQLYLQIVGRAS